MKTLKLEKIECAMKKTTLLESLLRMVYTSISVWMQSVDLQKRFIDKDSSIIERGDVGSHTGDNNSGIQNFLQLLEIAPMKQWRKVEPQINYSKNAYISIVDTKGK